MTRPQYATTCELFTPNACRRLKARGLQPAIDYARRRGVARVGYWRLRPGMPEVRVHLTFEDGFYSLYTMPDAEACRAFHSCQWPGVSIEEVTA
jgi:hypothetical protein